MARKSLRIGIALGSGAARGWAHIGILRGLQQLGIEPDLVAGCSIGALVGAAYAAGELEALETWVRGFNRLQVMALLDPAFSGGLLRGDKVFGIAEERVGELTFAAMKKPFACVATELETGRERWLQEGGVMAAVRASCSIPGMFVPVRINEQWLIDGAVVNPVPISLCRAMGADLVIAVNLNSDVRHCWTERDDEVTPKNPLLQWLSKRNSHSAPGMISVMNGAISIMQERITRARMAGDPPDIALNQLAARDKQVEMAFYLPIAQLLTAERLDALIRQYDPLSADTPPLDFRQVRGMLKGFIDLVFRHEGRYYLLDYKSNWLGEDREAYTRPAMEQAMRAHRYDLQYQLYSLALHRYLRHRLADYDYDRHFGGVIYLFLRGMDGQEGGQGIFTTRPVRPLIDGLDQLFAGETQEEAS